MQIYCTENEYITPAVRYTIDFLLNRAGFFFRWEKEETLQENSGIVLSYGKKTRFARKPSIHLPRIYDLAKLSGEEPEWHEFTINDTTLPVLGLSKSSAEPVPFDLTATVFFFISRLEEKDFRRPDDADSRYKNSLLYRYGQFQQPLTDILSFWLAEKIIKLFRESGLPYLLKSDFPGGKQMGLALTHDVDITRVYHPLHRHFLQWKSPRKKQDILRAEEEIWAFDRLLPFYREKGWTATFNFLARPWENTHYRYNLKSPRFRQLLKRLQEEGHEIGLHPSRYAFEHPQRYVKERRRLETAAGQTIWGMRQHYLRALFPTLWKQVEHIGLKYDATLAYRRQSGFRAGVCAPFNCFDFRENRALDCMEFPTAFFESSLPENVGNEAREIEAIEHFFAITQKYRGLLTVLWHPSNMYHHPQRSRLWNEIIKRIEIYHPYLVTLKQHYNWQKAREGMSIDFLPTKDNLLTIKIKTKEPAQNIDVVLYGATDRVIGPDGTISLNKAEQRQGRRLETDKEELNLQIMILKKRHHS